MDRHKIWHGLQKRFHILCPFTELSPRAFEICKSIKSHILVIVIDMDIVGKYEVKVEYM